MKLQSYIFIKDPEKTKTNRSLKQRTYLLGILAGLIGLCFILLDLPWIAWLFITSAVVLTAVGRFVLANSKDKGSIPGLFTIDNDDVTILNQTFKIHELKDLHFTLINYEDGPTRNEFKKAEGNENIVSFRLREKILTMNFYIPTSKHYHDLIYYLEDKEISFTARRGLLGP